MPKANDEQVMVMIGLDDLCKIRRDASSYQFYYQQYNDNNKEKAKLLGEIADLKKELAAEVELVANLKRDIETCKSNCPKKAGKSK